MLNDTPAIAQSDPSDMQRRVVELLRSAAEQTGDARYRVALGVVCGGRQGRPARDDRSAVAAVSVMLASGQAESVERAARWVARALPGERSEASAATRIARKYRRTASDVNV
jgi:hypothetical protein